MVGFPNFSCCCNIICLYSATFCARASQDVRGAMWKLMFENLQLFVFFEFSACLVVFSFHAPLPSNPTPTDLLSTHHNTTPCHQCKQEHNGTAVWALLQVCDPAERVRCENRFHMVQCSGYYVCLCIRLQTEIVLYVYIYSHTSIYIICIYVCV